MTFAVMLTMLIPAGIAWSLFRLWSGNELIFAAYPVMRAVFSWQTVISVSVTIYGAWVGWRIANLDPSGKILAHRYLQYRLIAFSVYSYMAFELMRDLPPSMVEDNFKTCLKTIGFEIAFFAVWQLYFRYSKRIRNTFGSEST